MKVATSSEMQDIDRAATEEYGIPAPVLMENAGKAVAKKIRELFEPKKTIVLAGGGKNGGDAIVVARLLHNSGWQGHIKVILLLKEDKLSHECLEQYRTAKRFGVPIYFRASLDAKDLHAALVVDGIFGTGLSRAIKGEIADIVASINNSGNPVISIDMPSGVSSDTGEVMGVAVKASYTVTFGLPKRGHLLYPGRDYAGELFIEDIGFPEALLKNEKLKCALTEKDDIARIIPKRKRYSHKGDYGHVLVVAGSGGKTGAALMAAKAALRTGSGLVTIGAPRSLSGLFQSRVVEEMTLPLPETSNSALSLKALEPILEFLDEKADVLAIGPGIGTDKDTVRLVNELIPLCPTPMVVDADAINCLKGKHAILRKAKHPLIITPHPGEMKRLLNLPGIDDIEKDRIGRALGFSGETRAYLVLKGAPTITASPDGRAFINPTGGPAMAKAGAGDVLTGMIASFVGQGISPLDASVLGVYMHGLSGDIASGRLGEHSVLASDIIDSIPFAFRSSGH
jgi:NAD(P)H-hydrate epimerase